MMSQLSSSPSSSPIRRIALGAAAALGVRTRRATPDALAPARTAPVLDVDGGELTAGLTRLHDDHVELVNAAVGEGREDLLQELSDSYVEQAMALMTAAGLPPARAAQALAA